MIKSSPTLLEFYKSYQQWLDNGAKPCAPYLRDDGLCRALVVYGLTYFKNSIILNAEFRVQLTQASLERIYPFGGIMQFNNDVRARTMHTNPLRLAWVRGRIADMENDNDQG